MDNMTLLALPHDCVGVIVAHSDIFAANSLLQTCRWLTQTQIERNYEIVYAAGFILVEFPLCTDLDRGSCYISHELDDRYKMLLTLADDPIYFTTTRHHIRSTAFYNGLDHIRAFMNTARLLPRDFFAILDVIKIDRGG